MMVRAGGSWEEIAGNSHYRSRREVEVEVEVDSTGGSVGPQCTAVSHLHSGAPGYSLVWRRPGPAGPHSGWTRSLEPGEIRNCPSSWVWRSQEPAGRHNCQSWVVGCLAEEEEDLSLPRISRTKIDIFLS